MTERQLKHLYFPAWRRAWAAMQRAGYTGPAEFEALREIAQVLASDKGLSDPGQDQNIWRHACHEFAFGRAMSSKVLTNPQLDRIVALFGMLADPDDINVRIRFANPAEDERKRLCWSIRHTQLATSYVAMVCRDKFGTDRWESLRIDQLRQLAMTIRARAKRAESTPAVLPTHPF